MKVPDVAEFGVFSDVVNEKLTCSFAWENFNMAILLDFLDF